MALWEECGLREDSWKTKEHYTKKLFLTLVRFQVFLEHHHVSLEGEPRRTSSLGFLLL